MRYCPYTSPVGPNKFRVFIWAAAVTSPKLSITPGVLPHSSVEKVKAVPKLRHVDLVSKQVLLVLLLTLYFYANFEI